jgi:hypothetical protein
LFGAKDWNPPPRRFDKAVTSAPTDRAAIPLHRFRQRGRRDSLMIVFANRQKQDFVLRIGDVLEQTYRVEAIDPQSVTLTYLPLRLTQVVPIAP